MINYTLQFDRHHIIFKPCSFEELKKENHKGSFVCIDAQRSYGSVLS